MLTPAQRLFFDLRGYVLLKGLFTPDECTALARIAADMRREGTEPRQQSARQCVLFGPAWHERLILQTAMDPRLRSVAEQIVGDESRLEENEFLFSFPAGSTDDDGGARPLRWHRGLAPGYGSFQSAEGYHCLFTKAIVYLTPRGRHTGTFVIPGSHRVEVAMQSFASLVSDEFIDYVDAERGDVLLFPETLIHSSPAGFPDQERLLLVIAYSAPFLKTWSTDTDPPSVLRYAASAEELRFIHGEGRYAFRDRHR